ncbi:hypothetical protein [Aeromicrobium sp.]|uniref:hypothetical protein n=1 Tax=Aeromicrobium sp. TaxID=1871063 RepID=UPI00198BA5BC|nr:hypothetical protein [Aeromicrobium sp.]MBC7633915.1 hypothetical protein [Aeromicrobium sp.]
MTDRLRDLGRMPVYSGLAFRGITSPDNPPAEGEVVVSTGVVAASMDLRVATENFRTAHVTAIVGSSGRGAESTSPHPHEREVDFLPGTSFTGIETFEVDATAVSLVVAVAHGSTVDPGADKPLSEVRALVQKHLRLAHERPDVEVVAPGHFVGDLGGEVLPADPQARAHLVDGVAVRVGSHEHYGWEEATYTVRGLHRGRQSSAEYLQVEPPDGRTRLFLRRRFDDLDWTPAEPGEMPVGSWKGEALPDEAPFLPEGRNPDSWLYACPKIPPMMIPGGAP